jgi:hypothetical protein
VSDGKIIPVSVKKAKKWGVLRRGKDTPINGFLW